ncbi:hypothetical protein ACLOJK_035314 [Asimina triloba]
MEELAKQSESLVRKEQKALSRLTSENGIRTPHEQHAPTIEHQPLGIHARRIGGTLRCPLQNPTEKFLWRKKLVVHSNLVGVCRGDIENPIIPASAFLSGVGFSDLGVGEESCEAGRRRDEMVASSDGVGELRFTAARESAALQPMEEAPTMMCRVPIRVSHRQPLPGAAGIVLRVT